MSADTLSLILRRLKPSAGVFVHASYRGAWAVDTSGYAKKVSRNDIAADKKKVRRRAQISGAARRTSPGGRPVSRRNALRKAGSES